MRTAIFVVPIATVAPDMSEQELQDFIAKMTALRAANTATPERAIACLKDEGYLNEDGEIAEPYTRATAEKR
jgi:hypothetical protein